ncbi:MAG TPA: hypothetical protein VI754_08995 [Bacteriovoracaceae bacterium]|nr:hypothetical protein [Bacteriovoracaceae bacterium]
MTLPAFLKEKLEVKESNKGNFKDKCLQVLEQIKHFNEEKYKQLSTTFHAYYDNENIQKKKIIGFYGQLVNELKQLRHTATSVISESTQKIQETVDSAKAEVINKSNEIAQKVKDKTEKAIKEVTTNINKNINDAKSKVAEVQKSALSAKKSVEKVVKEKASEAVKKATKKASAVVARATEKKTVTTKKAAPATTKKAAKKVAKKAAPATAKKKSTKKK